MKIYTMLLAVGLVTASQGQAQFIQNLIDAAAPGDTVVIPPGTYFENVIISKDITLQGAGAGSALLMEISWTPSSGLAPRLALTVSPLPMATLLIMPQGGLTTSVR